MSNTNDVSGNGVDSGDPVYDIGLAANLLMRITNMQADNLESQVDATAGLITTAVNMTNGMQLLLRGIKRNLAWTAVMAAVAAFTLGNLIVAMNLANKLSGVCGR